MVVQGKIHKAVVSDIANQIRAISFCVFFPSIMLWIVLNIAGLKWQEREAGDKVHCRNATPEGLGSRKLAVSIFPYNPSAIAFFSFTHLPFRPFTCIMIIKVPPCFILS